MVITTATQILDDHQIPYRLFVHERPVHSLEEAAAARGHMPEQVVRSLLFRLPGDEFVMVLMAGPDQVPWKALRRLLGTSRVTMAKPDEVKAVTGYVVGAVSPLGVQTAVRLLIDESVLLPKEISLGSGERGTAVLMQSADLRRLLSDAEMVQLAD